MKIIVDAYGGDHAPLEILKGAADARAQYGHDILLTGKETELRAAAAENGISLDGMEIVDAPDVISMNDIPKSILREHKDCSMAVGLRLLAEGAGDAFVSAGSTGALIMGATFLVKRIKGISRPALAAIVPSAKAPFMLVDSGANVDCRPEMLMQFARMGSIYMTEVMQKGRTATVGLLNVGTEEHKGGDLQHETYALLKNSDLNFIGNVEARDVPAGIADVVVTDGFGGNVLLKGMEGTVDMLMGFLKGILYATPFTKLAALTMKSRFGGLKKKLSTAEHGGAPLLGVSRPVIKAHGNSKAFAIQNAIRIAADFAAADVIGKIAASVSADKKDEE
ncbi:MAG: phosphate acyltransferase PlsX [Clostridia bacterium]|nr:phosphate acyltransferase PlsX [Clostridia bacterium]